MITFVDLKPGADAGDVRAAIDRVLERGWFILGPELDAFETEFAAASGATHAVGVGTGTDALAIALRALGIGRGDEVITSPLSAAYSALAIMMVGARPVFADIDPARLTLDPDQAAAAVTSRTRALIPVHLYGQPADMSALMAVAKRHRLAVVEDCCQAHLATCQGRPVGSFGDAAAYSFYPTKNLGAIGDGGAVTSSDDILAARVRQLRQYGWGSKYSVTLAHGRNSRLDELQAAFLRIKLPLLDGWNARRRAIAARYAAGISHPGITLPALDGAAWIGHLYVVQCERRDALREHLEAHAIGADVHYPIPDHRQPLFAAEHAGLSLPAAEWQARTALSLPCFAELRDAEVDAVIAACNAWSG